MSSKNIDFGSDLGLKLKVMRLNLGFPVVFDQKEGYYSKCLVFFRPDLEAKLASKNLLYVARRPQELSGEGPGGIFLRVKI